MREPALVTVKVSRGTQLSYGGTTYVSGAEVQAPEHIAERWIVRGWAEPNEPQRPRLPRARHGLRSAPPRAAARSRTRR